MACLCGKCLPPELFPYTEIFQFFFFVCMIYQNNIDCLIWILKLCLFIYRGMLRHGCEAQRTACVGVSFLLPPCDLRF